MKKISIRGAAIVILALSGAAPVASAAEVKVFSTIGVRAVMQELGPRFERASGHRLTMTFDVANALKRQIEAGEKFDVAILTVPVLDDLIKQGRIVADTRVTVARGGLGVAVRTGAPRPDIGSIEALKRVLLDAKSVAYPKEGLTGINFVRVQERLEIADRIQPKAILTTAGSPAELVARGEAEMAVHLIPELLAVAGVELLGPLPPQLQSYIVLPGAVAADALQPRAAGDFLQYLVGPEAISVMKSKGYEPG